MNGFANILLRAFGITPVHGGDIHTEEELKMIITESQEGGAIEETERELIENVFEFDDRRVINVYRSEEHTSELQSVRISYAVFCLKKKKTKQQDFYTK